MANNLRKLRMKAGLSIGQLASTVGSTALEIQRIESNQHPADIELARAMSAALDQPIQAIFPGASRAIATFVKELEGPTHVSAETYELLREVGLEGDTRRHTFKVLLRGHQRAMSFDISAAEADGLFGMVQDETKGDEAAFIVFDSDRLRVAMNLRAVVFCHFLWDPNIGTIIRSEAPEDDEDLFNAVHVYFDQSVEPTVIGAEAEDGRAGSDRSYLNRVFVQLSCGMAQPHHRLHVVDEDGESAFLRVGDISVLTAPLWLLDPDERVDDEDDEDDED
jgi:transcriptional regulator with XRE-family HTH domain